MFCSVLMTKRELESEPRDSIYFANFSQNPNLKRSAQIIFHIFTHICNDMLALWAIVQDSIVQILYSATQMFLRFHGLDSQW